MKCTACKRNIAAGVDAQKMIVEYQQPDGATKVFGYMMADGPLSTATGQLVRAWHHKHYHAERKREAKGAAALPFDGTATEHMADLNAVAAEIGKPVGDPYVTEAYKAKLHGRPYPHTHQFRLETYQLMAHLKWAHACTDTAEGYGGSSSDWHQQLHARMAAGGIAAERAQDPGHIDPPERDWRDQAVANI